MRDDTIAAFLEQLAARVPAPGGGATAALHAAQAAALLAMVARYSDGPRYDAELMARIIADTDALREDALALAEADAVAFGSVAQAYQLPDQVLRDEFAATAAVADTVTARADAIVAAVRDRAAAPACDRGSGGAFGDLGRFGG